ncbi:hypothetical protein [Streptomyces sp. NPDC050416]|uniref:hypothetical protein n=1 Tax=Streptomyces sp. NPDC050416 TaxID=3365611 RepID=UPI0037A06ACA
MLRWAGWALRASCLVFAVSGGHGVLLDSAALLGGALVLVLGELCQASASWGLSFGLAPAGRQGEYQAVFSLGRGLQQFAGPWLMTSLVVGAAATGWLGPRGALRPARARRAAVGARPGEGPRADGAGAGLSGPAGARPDHMRHTRPTETSRRAP